MNNATKPDPMASYLADLHITQESKALKDQVKRHRKAAEDAEQKLTESSKPTRDAVRAQARRAQFAGEVFFTLAGDNPVIWTDFRPNLNAALELAADDIRALFKLPPKPEPEPQKQDTKEGRKSSR